MKSVWISVDVEADGPVPGLHSMTELGAVVVEPSVLDAPRRVRAFYARLTRLPNATVVPAHESKRHARPPLMLPAGSELTSELTVAQTGFVETTLASPTEAMTVFEVWLTALGARPMFVSDNNGFDWMFVCWYFHRFLGRCPFGWSSTNLGSLYKGAAKDCYASFKALRQTPHTHHPVADALGNAEAMVTMARTFGIKGVI